MSVADAGADEVMSRPCEFTEFQHVLFQVANALLLISYAAPHGIYGDLFLRITLTIGLLLLTLWAGIVICGLDVLLWNGVFTVINAFHALWILWRLRPWITFPPDVEEVYRKLFMPMKVSKESFHKIYKCVRNFETLNKGDTYCQEDVTKVDRLSLVLHGKMGVMKHGKATHAIEKHQFVDSPEWFGLGGDKAPTTIKAMEVTKLMTWNRDKLKLTIADNDYLKAVLDNILGKDVVKKLQYTIEHQDRESLQAMNTNANNKTSNDHGTNGPTNETTKLIKDKANGGDVILCHRRPVSSFWSLFYDDRCDCSDGDSGTLFFDYETNV